MTATEVKARPFTDEVRVEKASATSTMANASTYVARFSLQMPTAGNYRIWVGYSIDGAPSAASPGLMAKFNVIQVT